MGTINTIPALPCEMESELTLQQANDELQNSDIDVRFVLIKSRRNNNPADQITFIVHPSFDDQETILSELDCHFPVVLSHLIIEYVPDCRVEHGIECLEGMIYEIEYIVKRFQRIDVQPKDNEYESKIEEIEIIGVLHPVFI